MKAIIAAVLIIIIASSARAEDVYLYDMTNAGVPPSVSLKDAVMLLRHQIKESFEIAIAHSDPNIVRNDTGIQRTTNYLWRYYGFTQEHINREFQIAMHEFKEEHGQIEIRRAIPFDDRPRMRE